MSDQSRSLSDNEIKQAEGLAKELSPKPSSPTWTCDWCDVGFNHNPEWYEGNHFCSSECVQA